MCNNETGRSNLKCGHEQCVDMRHHWLEIKLKAGRLSTTETAELKAFNKRLYG